MSEPERREQTPEDNQDSTAAYATTAVGVALLIGAVLLILTTGVPVSGIGLVIGGAACLGWGLPQVLNRRREQQRARATLCHPGQRRQYYPGGGGARNFTNRA
ncbi:MAG: hypothetical protein WA982_14560 [Rubrobacteraceae bacterium]